MNDIKVTSGQLARGPRTPEVLEAFKEQLRRDVTTEQELKALREVAEELTVKIRYRGIDLYGDTAKRLGCTRPEAKARILGEAYGLITLSPLEKVAEFHTKFELPGFEQETPRELTDEEALFRINFMLEELAEYAAASGLSFLSGVLEQICQRLKSREPKVCHRTSHRDLHGELDALIDLSYVLHGTALFHGFRKFDKAFDTVHMANMSKVRATSEDQSKRGTKLDVVKPTGWKAPVLTEYLT